MWAFFLQMDKDVSWNNKLDNYKLIFKMAAPEKKIIMGKTNFSLTLI